MNQNTKNSPYDCVIIGTGTAGATLARELSAKGSRVLMLERGEHRTLKETAWGMASILNEVKVAHKLKDPRVFAAGGSSALYLAVAEAPPLDVIRALGIDLAQDYEAARRELPLMEMPDDLLSPQTLRLRDAAIAQGYDWTKNTMLIDRSRCRNGYDYGSKWKAISYVDEAVKNGAVLQCEAVVDRVLIEDGEAVGVECRIATSPFRSRSARFYARSIVVSAGSLATPIILRKSGLTEAVSAGYYIDPSIAVIGRVPGLRGTNSFAGTMGTTLDDGTRLLDANLHRFFFNMGMVQSLRLLRIPQYPQHVSIMVKAHDAVGGGLSKDGRYHKEIEPETHENLKRGVDVAKRILAHAGAKTVYCPPLMTGGAFGTLRLGEDVDANLQTRVRNLHVCDGSLIPHSARVAPTLTLVCLAKHLARVLLDRPSPVAGAELPLEVATHRFVSDP
jgi:choline dehydrogenase-like flavoprotein